MPAPRCALVVLAPPEAQCACGQKFEVDAYIAHKTTDTQRDVLMDMWLEHEKQSRARKKNAPKDK